MLTYIFTYIFEPVGKFEIKREELNTLADVT